MKKKKTVFLFGAGAILLWGAPTTKELTTLIRNSGFKTSDNQTYITEFIYQTLLAKGFQDEDINFETIINVIEELLVYYSWFNSTKKIPSLLQGFFSPNFESAFFNYSIKSHEQKDNYQLEIPKGQEYHFSQFSQRNEAPHQFFLQHLMIELLTSINDRISEYSYHTTGASVLNFEKEESKLFVKWMRFLSKESSLRLYTLNYDRVFKILLAHNGIDVFEGFDCGEFIDYSNSLRANVCKILTDADSNVHYNLHGSASWKVESLDETQLSNPEFLLACAPQLLINDDHVTSQIERGKTIMPTNIITGYQKVQKTVISPLKQMHAAFDRDCCFADDIYIIGYSLGDEYINESIKTAIRHNDKVKITIVDPFFFMKELNLQLAINFFPLKKGGAISLPTIVADKRYTFFDGDFQLHTLDFKDFLVEQCNR